MSRRNIIFKEPRQIILLTTRGIFRKAYEVRVKCCFHRFMQLCVAVMLEIRATKEGATKQKV